MFRSNIPLRIWGTFAGILFITSFLCISISYNFGVSNAVITVGSDNYRASDAEKIIEDSLNLSNKLKADLYDLQIKYQDLDANYSALINDFDELYINYEMSEKKIKSITAELNVQKAKSESLSMQNFDLSKQLEDSVVNNEELGSQIKSLKTQLEDQNRYIESLSNQLSNLQNDNNSLNSLVNNFRKRLEDLYSILGS